MTFLNASPISAEAFLFYQSKAYYRLVGDDMYDKSGMSLLESGTRCYQLLIEPCNLTIANNLFKNIGDKWEKERRDANYILPPLGTFRAKASTISSKFSHFLVLFRP